MVIACDYTEFKSLGYVNYMFSFLSYYIVLRVYIKPLKSAYSVHVFHLVLE